MVTVIADVGLDGREFELDKVEVGYKLSAVEKSVYCTFMYKNKGSGSTGRESYSSQICCLVPRLIIADCHVWTFALLHAPSPASWG